MPATEINLTTLKTVRSVLVVGGLPVAYAALLTLPPGALSDGLFTIGLGLCVYGCYFWAKLKGRHWAWMLFGLLAPAGLLVLLMLQPHPSAPGGGARP